ncbi:hypothetical protein HWV62_40806 [Athelia sp. TMB]|nr:hypothetical protein HWV62_40806 [Athelia sp. TMB]
MSSTIPIACTITYAWSPDMDYDFMNALRTEHYPPELLFNPAHVGLFTRVAVPPARLEQAKADIKQVAALHTRFSIKFQSNVRLFGKCVVLRVNPNHAGHIFSIRNVLNERWAHAGFVDPQERSHTSYQPHVTIHARVSKQEAKKLSPIIANAFESRVVCVSGNITGINLWEYKEGQPWALIEHFPFA